MPPARCGSINSRMVRWPSQWLAPLRWSTCCRTLGCRKVVERTCRWPRHLHALPIVRRHVLMETLEKDLAQQIERLASALDMAEQYAKQMLQTVRAQRRSFGLAYNYLDEDITQVRGRLRYMQLMARQWEVEEMRSSERPTTEQVTISSTGMMPAKRKTAPSAR